VLEYREHLRFMAAWGINGIENWREGADGLSVAVRPREAPLVLSVSLVVPVDGTVVLHFKPEELQRLQDMPADQVPLELATWVAKSTQDSILWKMFGQHYLEARLSHGV
jgi:hypothetical protein